MVRQGGREFHALGGADSRLWREEGRKGGIGVCVGEGWRSVKSLLRGWGEGYKRLTGLLSRDQDLEGCQPVGRGKGYRFTCSCSHWGGGGEGGGSIASGLG